MKRGFLLPKNGKKRVQKSIPGKPLQSDAKPKSLLTIPTGPIECQTLLEVCAPPDQEKLPTINTGTISQPGFIVTTLPPYSYSNPHEPLACALLWGGMKEQILAVPGFPAPLNTPSPPVYTIGPVKGAGLGLFTTKDLDTGDLILCERPMFIAPAHLPVLQSSPEADFNNMTSMVVDRFDHRTREDFFALHNCKNSRHTVKDIVDTNALSVGALPGFEGLMCAVCKDLSRVNHSCVPNATYRWHLKKFAFELRARGPIGKGEQIFIHYNDIFQPRRIRQQYLKDSYGFVCTCPSCTLPAEESKRSDERRHRMPIITEWTDSHGDSELRAWVQDLSAPNEQIIDRCMELADDMMDEGFYDGRVWPACFQQLCKAYCALGDADNASKWARKAAALQIAETGGHGGWKAIADSPQNTNWWELRDRARKGRLNVV